MTLWPPCPRTPRSSYRPPTISPSRSSPSLIRVQNDSTAFASIRKSVLRAVLHMALSIGIVGLPNVGKSTLFNSLSSAKAEAANYPFCTIEPNVGVVIVPDERLDKIDSVIHAEKIVPTTFNFVDIAGLVRGASKGEGLGNQFLSHIREADAIVQVGRCFDDPNVIHVENKVDPVADIAIVTMELCLKDLETVNKRGDKARKMAKANDPKEKLAEQVCDDLGKHLNEGK